MSVRLYVDMYVRDGRRRGVALRRTGPPGAPATHFGAPGQGGRCRAVR